MFPDRLLKPEEPEKYNVTTGTTDVVDEYKMPRMVGWTAGVFVFAAQRLEQLPEKKFKP